MHAATVQLTALLPDDMEFTGEYRLAADGEPFYSPKLSGCVAYGPTVGYVLILRERYKLPDWLASGAWVWPNGQHWYTSMHMPEPMVAQPLSYKPAEMAPYECLTNGTFNFTPPPERKVYRAGEK